METLTFKQNKEFEAVRWNDNCSEMKRFCGDKCTITYETCCIDDYWSLKVYDYLKHGYVTVALWDYVIKIDDGKLFVLTSDDVKLFFDVVSEDKSALVEPMKTPEEIKSEWL